MIDHIFPIINVTRLRKKNESLTRHDAAIRPRLEKPTQRVGHPAQIAAGFKHAANYIVAKMDPGFARGTVRVIACVAQAVAGGFTVYEGAYAVAVNPWLGGAMVGYGSYMLRPWDLYDDYLFPAAADYMYFYILVAPGIGDSWMQNPKTGQ